MQSRNKIKIISLIRISIFAALISIVTILIPPIIIMGVPITMQTLMIMLTASLLKPKDAFLSILLYLVLGIIGLPVFSSYSSGIGIILGPTGGFLISFLLVGFLISYFKQDKLLNQIVINIIFGVILVNIIGILQMSIVNHLFFLKVLKIMIFFIPIDIVKAIIASLIYMKIRVNFLYE